MVRSYESTLADCLFRRGYYREETKPRRRTPTANGTSTSISRAAARLNTLFLRQDANRIEGAHHGDYVARDVFGSISGDAMAMTSRYTEQHGDALTFTFSGTVAGDSMATSSGATAAGLNLA